MTVQTEQQDLEQLAHCWMQEGQAGRSHWEHGLLVPWAFWHTQHPTGANAEPWTGVVLCSLPSCPISVCPLRSVWLTSGFIPNPDGCIAEHFSASIFQIFPMTALVPLKSRSFVFSKTSCLYVFPNTPWWFNSFCPTWILYCDENDSAKGYALLVISTKITRPNLLASTQG